MYRLVSTMSSADATSVARQTRRGIPRTEVRILLVEKLAKILVKADLSPLSIPDVSPRGDKLDPGLYVLLKPHAEAFCPLQLHEESWGSSEAFGLDVRNLR